MRDTKIAPAIAFCDALKLFCHKHIPPQTLFERITVFSPSPLQKFPWFCFFFARIYFQLFSLQLERFLHTVQFESADK